jgi:hypothetical protein
MHVSAIGRGWRPCSQGLLTGMDVTLPTPHREML